MQQTGKKIESVTAYDYRSYMVPLLKSFMRVCVGFSLLFVASIESFYKVTFLPVYDFMLLK